MKRGEDLMREWDTARAAIAAGNTSSWPRDWFESVIDARDERISDLDERISDLEGYVRAAVAELNVIRQIAHGDPDRVKMLAENAIEFLRVGIEKQ